MAALSQFIPAPKLSHKRASTESLPTRHWWKLTVELPFTEGKTWGHMLACVRACGRAGFPFLLALRALSACQLSQLCESNLGQEWSNLRFLQSDCPGIPLVHNILLRKYFFAFLLLAKALASRINRKAGITQTVTGPEKRQTAATACREGKKEKDVVRA